MDGSHHNHFDQEDPRRGDPEEESLGIRRVLVLQVSRAVQESTF